MLAATSLNLGMTKVIVIITTKTKAGEKNNTTKIR